MFMDLARNFFQRLPCSRRRFGHHDADQFGMASFQCFGQVVWAKHFSPGSLNAGNLGAGSFCDICHPHPEHTIDTDDHGVPRFNEVDDGGFHAGRAGGTDCHGHLIACPKQVAQHSLQVVHDLQIVGVQVSYGRFADGFQDSRMDITGTGSHEGSDGRIQWSAHGVEILLARGALVVTGWRWFLDKLADGLEFGTIGSRTPFKQDGLGAGDRSSAGFHAVDGSFGIDRMA